MFETYAVKISGQLKDGVLALYVLRNTAEHEAMTLVMLHSTSKDLKWSIHEMHTPWTVGP